jgi:hypothetical protein
MRAVWDTVLGLFDLLRIAAASGFRFKGAYWEWRLHTAFGRGYPPRRELIRGLLDYARWVRRMRRMM